MTSAGLLALVQLSELFARPGNRQDAHPAAHPGKNLVERFFAINDLQQVVPGIAAQTGGNPTLRAFVDNDDFLPELRQRGRQVGNQHAFADAAVRRGEGHDACFATAEQAAQSGEK